MNENEIKKTKQSLDLDSSAEPYSIYNIKDTVEFVFISNDAWQECIDASDDNDALKQAIMECSRTTRSMSDNIFEKAEQIDYIFALYKSEVVGTYKLINKPLRRCELDSNYIESKFPCKPLSARTLEKLYTSFCAKANSLEEAEEICKMHVDILSVAKLYEVIGINNKTKAKNILFENWKHSVFFELEYVELSDFIERKLLLIPTTNDPNNLNNARKFTHMDVRNFTVTPNGLKVKDISSYVKKSTNNSQTKKPNFNTSHTASDELLNDAPKRANLHTFILFTMPLIAFIICFVIAAIKFFSISIDCIPWIVATIICGVLWGCGSMLDDYCCPKCGCWFCLSKNGERVVSKREITIQETRKVQKYSNYHKQYGDYQTYTVNVPGTEYKMNVFYHCNKCGSSVTRQTTKQYKH